MKLRKSLKKLRALIGDRKRLPQPAPFPAVSAISISMVKNEQDIIEPFLRHNRQFFDAMIVLDHGSTDRTAEIIRDCSKELDGIFFTHIARFDYAQSEYMTAALKYVQSGFFADIVCFLDADEFIPCADRATFLDALSAVPAGHASEHPWQTFLPDPALTPDSGRDWLPDMTCRRAEEHPHVVKCFLRAGGGTEPDLAVGQGNHGFSLNGAQVPHHPVRSAPLLHFPVRSARQIITRGAVGWSANLARKETRPKAGAASQWKRLYELARTGTLELSQQDLCTEAMAYAQDAVPDRFADNAVPANHGIATLRKYSDGQPGEPYRTIATSLLHTETWRPFDVGAAVPRPAEKSDVDTAFDGAWHWQNFFLDAPPFRYLAQKYRPASVLDVGCGTGLYLRLLQHDGVGEVLGLDGLELGATALDARTYQKTDLAQPFDAGRTFDLVFCLEVAEHIAADAMGVLFDTIENHARDLIVFSMAEPGQPGNGHINCRTMAEVIDLWQARGWAPDLIETLGVRALSTMAWFRRNIVVLRRGPPDAAATEALLRIANLEYLWYYQERGPRQTAFEQVFPPQAVGYGRVLPPEG